MIRKVVQSGNPVLRQIAKNVSKVDKKTLSIVTDLKDTLKTQKEPEGVGLAAPQIGKSVRIFIADYKNFQRVIINPKILKVQEDKGRTRQARASEVKGKGKKEILEGCLSLPYYYGPLKRAGKVLLKYLDEKGEEITEEFTDFNAQIIMHEIDHLNGILFVDRLLEEKKPLYKVDGDEWEEMELT